MYPFRPYTPRLGRWLTRDSIGEDGGPNLYAFVDNNPQWGVDPLGLASVYVDVTPNTSKLEVGAVIQARIPPCGKRGTPQMCDSVRWMQFLVYEKWVRFNRWQPWSTTSAITETKWLLDGHPWYTRDVWGPNPMSNGGQQWGLDDRPGVIWYSRWGTTELRQDYETCAVCFGGCAGGGGPCTVACAKWGHHIIWQLGGWSHTTYRNGNQSHSPSPKMLAQIKKAVGKSYAGMCKGW